MTLSEWPGWERHESHGHHPRRLGHDEDASSGHVAAHFVRTSVESDLAPEPGTDIPVVLIAEDEETIAESLAMVVEEAGYIAVVALDGRQALMLARSRRPQLILTDLMMPYMSGSDLIASVRQDAAASGETAPYIALITAASRARAEEAGADVVVSKPFDIDKIEKLLNRLLGADSR